MTTRTVTSLAFAAGCALAFAAVPAAQAQNYVPVETHLATNAPQASRGDFGDWSAARNNAESAQYERLLRTNPGFRQARVRKECGPITDAQLRQSCIASFGQNTASMASDTTDRWDRETYNERRRGRDSAGNINTGGSGMMTGEAGYGSSMEPVPGMTGQQPWEASRNYPGQGTSVPPAGAMPGYPGSRPGGSSGGGM